jgi:hypothetical protein
MDCRGSADGKSERDRAIRGIVYAHLGVASSGPDDPFIPPTPEWYYYRSAAEWLRVSVPQVDDVPSWWLDRAFAAIEAENEVTKQRENQNSAQAKISEMHRGA